MSRKAFMVLGMHRSGTSAVAAVLHMCGATIGSGMLKASENNPKGYFESAFVLEAMDQLLEACGSFWHDWRELDLSKAHPAVLATLKRKILGNFRRNFGQRDKFTFKNPRNCRAVPFWCDLLSEFDTQPIAVHVLRHPLEVTASLARRDAMPTDKTLLLWLRHVLDAERATRAMPRVFVRYEDLLSDWRAITSRIFTAADEMMPADMASAERRISAFLDSSLRHTDNVEPEGAVVAAGLGTALEVWNALSEIAVSGETPGAVLRLDAAAAAFEALTRPFGVYFATVEKRLMRMERLILRARDNLTLALQ